MILHCISEHLLLRCSWTLKKLKEVDIPVHSKILIISETVERLNLCNQWFYALCYASHPHYFPLVINYLKYLHFLQEPSTDKISLLFSESLCKCPYQKTRDKLLYNYTTQKMKGKCEVMLKYHTDYTEGSRDGSRDKIRLLWKNEQDTARSSLEKTLTKCYTKFKTSLEEHWERSKGYPASNGNDCFKQYFVSEDCSIRLEEIESLTQRTPHLDIPEMSPSPPNSTSPQQSSRNDTSIPPYQIPLSAKRTECVKRYVNDIVPNIPSLNIPQHYKKTSSSFTDTNMGYPVDTRNKTPSKESKGPSDANIGHSVPLNTSSPVVSSTYSSGEASLGLQSTQHDDDMIRSDTSAGERNCEKIPASATVKRDEQQHLRVMIEEMVKKCVQELMNESVSKTKNASKTNPDPPYKNYIPEPLIVTVVSAGDTAAKVNPCKPDLFTPTASGRSDPITSTAPSGLNPTVPITSQPSQEPLPLTLEINSATSMKTTVSTTTNSIIGVLEGFLCTASSASTNASVADSSCDVIEVVDLEQLEETVRPDAAQFTVPKRRKTTVAGPSSNKRKQQAPCRKSVRVMNKNKDKPLVDLADTKTPVLKLSNSKRHTFCGAHNVSKVGTKGDTKTSIFPSTNAANFVIGSRTTEAWTRFNPVTPSVVERTIDHLTNFKDTASKKRSTLASKRSEESATTRKQNGTPLITISPLACSSKRTSPATSSTTMPSDVVSRSVRKRRVRQHPDLVTTDEEDGRESDSSISLLSVVSPS